MKKTLTLNTNLVPMFSGTYETIWEPREYNEEGTAEVAIDYTHEDLMRSIAEAYHQKEAYILSELNCPFITAIRFTGGFTSPSEYNFRTDELDFEIDIEEVELHKTLKKLKDDGKFSEFLKDNYSSYDGFMSFTPNNYEDIAENVINNGRDYEQAVSAIITYLAKDNLIIHGGASIEEMVYDDWQGNSYMGLEYKYIQETL